MRACGRLTEDPSVRVLVIEAGGRDSRLAVRIPAAFSRLFKTTCDWNYTTVPQPQLGGRSLYWPRGRMLGGTSSMNAQMHVRGNRADYDGWAALGNRGWSYDDEGRRAAGVEYLRCGAVATARATREIILVGGAINSPQLLMLSGVGPAGHLGPLGIKVAHDLPGVARHLQDHLVCGMLTSNVAEACGFFRIPQDAPAPNLELLFAPVPFIDHGLTRPTEHGLSVGVVLLQPRSAGSVTLRSANPLEAP